MGRERVKSACDMDARRKWTYQHKDVYYLDTVFNQTL